MYKIITNTDMESQIGKASEKRKLSGTLVWVARIFRHSLQHLDKIGAKYGRR